MNTPSPNPTPEQLRWQRVEELFHRALALAGSPDERAAAVRSWTGEDGEMAGEVLSLVESSDAVEDAAEVARSSDAPKLSNDAWLGRVVGGYRMVAELGRGGMGAVYAAERADAAEGRVAIKVVATRLCSPLLIERFAEERRALAALRHPHIAHLLDGGVTEAAEPYFVMELIEGQRLDHYCQSRNLGPKQILALFGELCGAVAFAHTHRILHGDLKPSNVLVTAAGELKLVDFGAAMLLAPEGNAGAESTPLAAFTPEYASPEQSAGKPCGAASDVYSLGAMLHCLLTGRAPARAETQPEPSVPAIVELDADLAAVIARATAADPEARYASAADLAADLRRYCERRPVAARPAPVTERVVKFAGRNRGNLLTGLALACALGAGAATAIRQTQAARAEEQRARRQMTAVRQLAGFLSTDLYDRLTEVPGSLETQRRITAQALEYLDGMSRDASGDFDFEVDLATAYNRVGNVLGDPYQPNLGDAQGAIRVVERGASIAQDALRMRPNDAHALRAAMEGDQTIAEIDFGSGAAPAALPHAQAAAALGEKLIARPTAASSPAATSKDFFDVAGIYSDLGDIYDLQGSSSLSDRPSAIASYRRFIALNQEALRRDAGNMRAVRAIGIGSMKIGNLLVEQNPNNARPYYAEALKQFGRIPNPPPIVPRQIAVVHQKMADCYYFEDNYRASLAELKIAADTYLPLAARDPENMRVQQTTASILNDEGENYEALKDWRSTRAVNLRLAALLSAALRHNPQNHIWQEHYAETLITLARAEWNLSARADSEAHERQGLALSVRLADAKDASPDDLDNTARHLLNARPASLRQPKQALAYSERANQMVHQSEPDDLMTLANARRAAGDASGARESAEKLLQLHPSKDARAEAEKLLQDLKTEKR